MPQGRPAHLQRLYQLELGSSLEMRPVADETLELVYTRLKQVVTKWLREGKAYRLDRKEDCVLATRVQPGSHLKLSRYTDLRLGECVFEGATLTVTERKALLARVDRMSNRERGYFFAEQHADGIYVRRVLEPNGKKHWYNERVSPPRVDLRQR